MLSTGSVSAPIPTRRRSSPPSSNSLRHHHATPICSSTAAPREDILRLIAECDATLEREPQCLHTRAVRGHACMKAKLWERAIADFDQIIASRPDDAHSRFSRGMALFKSGRVEHAHADFSRVLELNPHHVMARYARAGCYNTEGKFHHAIQDYTIALQHDEKEQDAVTVGRHGMRGWHGGAEKLVNEKLSASDVVRKSRGGGVGDGNGHSQRRATTSEGLVRRSDDAENEARRTSVATALPQENTGKLGPKKPRKVVQISLNLGAAPAPQAVVVPSVPPAHVADWIEDKSPRFASPRSNSRLRLQCVPASYSAAAPQTIQAETSARQSTPWMESHGLSNGAELASRLMSEPPASRIPPQPQSELAQVPSARSPLPLQQPPKRAVRRVTIAL